MERASFSCCSWSSLWGDEDVGVAVVGSLHKSRMQWARDTGAGMEQLKAFACNPLISDVPHRDPWWLRDCLFQKGICPGVRSPVCGKNNYYLLRRPMEKHLPGQQETGKSQIQKWVCQILCRTSTGGVNLPHLHFSLVKLWIILIFSGTWKVKWSKS